ncbi:MAG: M14 family zinc carboxypeptidase [Saprospiraceae bacterium]
MNNVKLSLLLLSFCFVLSIDAQSVLSRVTFPIDEQQTRITLAKAGLDLSHGHGKLDQFFTTEVQDFELERFKALGIRYQIDIPDLSQYRKAANHPTRGGGGQLECQDHRFDNAVPKNFELGSVGGFLSLPEVLDHLDAMTILYPHLISSRRPIGNFKTWKNNSLFWARISDQPETDEEEPEILYTGLHHAREFISVSQTIYYMWYLLENYEKNPMIKQMLDHTELYFVPVVNPDGLNYNVEGYDAIEGIFHHNHRKNMRDNDDDDVFDPKNDGVDLNRNYGWEWGFDEEGSSSFPGSDTYRGPTPFSEPETKALEFFCNSHEFKIALNYHSYGNLLVYPWGYEDLHTNDSTIFSHYGQLLTDLNRFVYGRGLETVGYITNGDSDDWMYGEHGIFAMTPELGDPEDGFYPLQENIIPLCQSTLEMNLLSARLINSLVSITDQTPRFINKGMNPLNLEFNRFGLLDGQVTISFNAASPEIVDVPAPFTINLEKFAPHQRSLFFVVDEEIEYGATAKIEVVIQQGTYSFRDTITKVRADFFTPVDDSGDLENWDKTDGTEWGLTTELYKSSPVSISDSPDGNYGENANEIILLNQHIDLTDVTGAYVQFWAQWDIEDHYDYVIFQASTDGENWDNLCGDNSKLGSLFQLYEQPLYDGKQTQWLLETTDLENYIGENIQLRFSLVSDGFVFRDGFYFDDFKIFTIKEESVATTEVDPSAFSVRPNPASKSFRIELPELSKPSVRIFDSIGKDVYNAQSLEGKFHQVNAAQWPSGLYQFVIYSEGEPVHSGLISLVP